jgi:hypothetical protein
VAALVLTRSRPAWLSFAAVMLVLIVAMLVSAPLRRDRGIWKRVAGVIALSAICVALSLALPNTLHWHGRNPYLDSVRNIAGYSEGSGRGRLVQYGHSLLIALHHPLLGAGPGNWPVDYPLRAARSDPSRDPNDRGMTANPWPSSDWFACISERGIAAFVLLAMAFLKLTASGLRQVRRSIDAQEALAAVAFLGVIAGAAVAATFDAVLLLAVPAFLVWSALGALWVPEEASPRTSWRFVVIAALLLSMVGVVRSTSQIVAMEIFATHSDRASLVRAAQIDPGSYRLQMRLARMGGRGRCEHARAAHALFPTALAPVEAGRGCGK